MYKGKTFSLVLPANEESNVKKNILSFQQTEIFDEIIVVDNNSTDNTASEVEIKCLLCKKNYPRLWRSLEKKIGITKVITL